jgi:hypothetical protein
LFTGVVDTSEKFITGVVATGDHCSMVCTRDKFIISVVVTSDNYSALSTKLVIFAGINDTTNHCKSVTKINSRFH